MVKVQDFSAGNFEANIEKIQNRVEQYEETNAGKENAPREKKEVIKAVLREMPSVQVPSSQSSSSVSPVSDLDDEIEKFLPDYVRQGSADGMREAVGRLVEIALHGDLEKSLHDALADKVLEEMDRRGGR